MSGYTKELLRQTFSKYNNNLLVGALNIHLITFCNYNSTISDFYNKCDVVSVDGSPLVYLSKFFSDDPFPEMVGGPNFWIQILKYGADKNYNFYFLGSKYDVLLKAKANLEVKFSNLKIVGMHHGYFDLSSKAFDNVVSDINNNSSDIIFIGMPSPKKELVADKLNQVLNGKKIVIIGGAFDYFAGEKKIGNEIISKLCLDWVLRIAQEPRRLMGRYIRTACSFVPILLKETMKYYCGIK